MSAQITHIDPEETIRKLKSRVARLEKALASQPAPVQEPVTLETVYETIIHWDEGGGKRSRRELARRIVDLYTTPPAQPAAWVGLTDEELYAVRVPMSPEEIARAVEAKLKEKNT